jgi:N-acetyl sugar amidotransferase
MSLVYEPFLGQSSPHGQICTRCVMDSSDPEIRFDTSGVCNHCHERDARVAAYVKDPAAALHELTALVEKIKADGKGRKYDCLIGVSGGVDSTYVAFEVKRLGLRPLAVHLDNGWDSEIAVGNIHSALDKLGIELHTHVINWEEIRDIQLAFLKSGVVDCEIPSDHAIVSSVQNLAKKLRIRHTIWGYNAITETHLPPAWSQGHFDFGYIRDVHRRFGNKHVKIKTFPHLSFWAYVTGNRYNQLRTNLLDYIPFNKHDATELLARELGWRQYGGKHHESLYTRWYQGWYLPIRWGYDKRKTHLSSLVCSGAITRVEALSELSQPTYDPEVQKEDIAYVMKKFGLNLTEFRILMEVPRRHYRDFASYRRIFDGPAYGAFLKVWQFFKYTLRGRSRN